MKEKLVFLVLLVLQSGFAQENSQVVSFLPDVFKQFPNVRDFTISSNEDEAYFSAQSPVGEI